MGWTVFERMDRERQRRGRMLDRLGLGPQERPHRRVLSRPGLALRAYALEPGASGPVLLIVPSPIKRPYLWDMAPGSSVVEQCVRAGLRTYLVDWERPTRTGRTFGLAQYADRFLLECLEAIRAETGVTRVAMAGHSLGGTLAALFASLHPERVRALVLLGAPLHFGASVGALGPRVALAPPPRLLTRLVGNVPGSLLGLASLLAAPVTFQAERWADALLSLFDREDLRMHLRVMRWAHDESPMAGQLFEGVVGWLYREDRFLRGTLRIGGRRALPGQLKAAVLNVVERNSRIVPASSVLPFHDALPVASRRLIWYEGDTGVGLQHVGMLVGRSAHRQLWPDILKWVHAYAGAPGGLACAG